MSIRPRAAALVFAAIAATSLEGCMVLPIARGCPGSDAIAPRLVPGVPRAQIENLVGLSISARRGDGGVVFRLYEYTHPGAVDGSTGLACLVAFGDVASAFILELVLAVQSEKYDYCAVHTVRRRAYVSYDAADLSLGAFGEYDVLPPDGRAPTSPSPADSGTPIR